MINELVAACEWDIGKFIIVSDNVFSPLIYYSHITPILVCLILGIYIYFANKRSLLNKTLLFITSVLSIWLFLDLILWATSSIRVVMISWSIINMIEPVIYAGFLYFMIIFATGKDLSHRAKFLLVLPFLPTILWGWTGWNVLGFNLTNCDREVVEGPLAFYNYLIEFGYAIAIAIVGIKSWMRSEESKIRNQSLAVLISILVLLLGFASGNIIGSFSEDWALGQIGLFVIPISIGVLSYFVIRLKFFNQSQIMAAQVLVLGLWIAVASVLFIQDISLVRWIVGGTLVFLTILGYILIRTFKIEIEQRKQIEKLAQNLETANKQQVILIHFITHQIKGFVSKSRNIFSLLLEGDYGPLSPEMRPMVEEGFQSDTKGANTIQEILSAANIKRGKVTYTKHTFDLKALIDETVTDLKQGAEKKGLTLIVETGDEPLMFEGDRAQLVNAIKNVIDNSIKYTVEGEVRVALKKEDGRILFTVTDTGVGITPEDMRNLFTEGGHGKDSQKVNVDSTGFGLYIVKNIVEAHGGKVHAESEGADKGSKFVVELPV